MACTKSDGDSDKGVHHKMLKLWTKARHGLSSWLPVVFTEINWSDHPQIPFDISQACSAAKSCEGAYLVDLFTYLNSTKSNYRPGLPISRIPIRVAWYRMG